MGDFIHNMQDRHQSRAYYSITESTNLLWDGDSLFKILLIYGELEIAFLEAEIQILWRAYFLKGI